MALRKIRIQAGVLSLISLVCTPGDRLPTSADISNTALAVDVRSVPYALWPGVAKGLLDGNPPPGLFIPVGLARMIAPQFPVRTQESCGRVI